MNRRQFLYYSTLSSLSTFLGRISLSLQVFAEDKISLEGYKILDAHAHPDRLIPPGRTEKWLDKSSTLKSIKALGMTASSFAAVGDQVFLSRGRFEESEFNNTMAQLDWWLNGIIKSQEARLIQKTSDISACPEPNRSPGVILSIEGGDPLEGKVERLHEFYAKGVRMITLVHYRNNELGDVMKVLKDLPAGPRNGGLTPVGRRIVERMQEIGMVVDVAHADIHTLKQIIEMSAKPLIDSHTHLCSIENPSGCGRLRTWREMEMVAKTGGVVCTWPLAYAKESVRRMTFSDWAKEILEIKKRLGMDHVGLGTDGGGHLSKRIEGYRDVGDLTKLIKAMEEIGFSREEIASYMGGNFLRVLKQCIG